MASRSGASASAPTLCTVVNPPMSVSQASPAIAKKACSGGSPLPAPCPAFLPSGPKCQLM